METKKTNLYDAVLVGAGIMSVTLARMIKELNPNAKILILEVRPTLGEESTGAWNNAGTGHAGLCELNYTPYKDGKIDIHKAVETTEAFEQSRQFWTYFVKKWNIDPTQFIHSVPHVSFVSGDDIPFLDDRYRAMKAHHFYSQMEISYDWEKINEWAPLLMKDRKEFPVGATYSPNGTDVNYEKLTRLMVDTLVKDGVEIYYGMKVKKIRRSGNGTNWTIKAKDVLWGGSTRWVETKFLFIGAGGATIPLLEKSGIPEAKGYGCFPISAQWLVCKNEEVISQHDIKAYGKAKVGSPPMSVSHLDTRWIDGRKELLFGPYPGLTSKFLKFGSRLDLLKSMRLSNIVFMVLAGWHNMPLNKYLFKEVTASFEKKLEELRYYYPGASAKDWKIKIGGQRVQIIKKHPKVGGVLEFGTEVIKAADRSIAGLAGASPGASTVAHIMSEVIKDCLPELLEGTGSIKMRTMIPSFGKPLADDPVFYKEILSVINKTLKTH